LPCLNFALAFIHLFRKHLLLTWFRSLSLHFFFIFPWTTVMCARLGKMCPTLDFLTGHSSSSRNLNFFFYLLNMLNCSSFLNYLNMNLKNKHARVETKNDLVHSFAFDRNVFFPQGGREDQCIFTSLRCLPLLFFCNWMYV